MHSICPFSNFSVCTSLIPLLASSLRVLLPPTWVVSGGGEEKTQGERSQGNRHLTNENSSLQSRHFKMTATKYDALHSFIIVFLQPTIVLCDLCQIHITLYDNFYLLFMSQVPKILPQRTHLCILAHRSSGQLRQASSLLTPVSSRCILGIEISFKMTCWNRFLGHQQEDGGDEEA